MIGLGAAIVIPSQPCGSATALAAAKIVALSKEHKKIILYSVLGKEAFYRKFGFRRMLTATALFENQEHALERGYVSET